MIDGPSNSFQKLHKGIYSLVFNSFMEKHSTYVRGSNFLCIQIIVLKRFFRWTIRDFEIKDVNLSDDCKRVSFVGLWNMKGKKQ